MTVAYNAAETANIPPLTAEEKAVVGEIKYLLGELEKAGAGDTPNGNLLHLSWDILNKSVAERLRDLEVARDKYALEE